MTHSLRYVCTVYLYCVAYEQCTMSAIHTMYMHVVVWYLLGHSKYQIFTACVTADIIYTVVVLLSTVYIHT